MLFDWDRLGGDYERLVVVQDEPSGLRAIIALHSTKRGPAAGGIRRMRYPDERAALDDALRLAAMMTAKLALADAPAGGGKTVILDHDGLDAPRAYRALGRAVEALGGAYLSGPDVGTGEGEMRELRAATRWANPAPNDANASTAAGVVAGIRGVLRALDGAADPRGRRFVVQGLGGVGLAVARALLDAGAEVLGSDPSAAAAQRAREAGVKIVAPDEALRTRCDVFVPCALGGVLTAHVARHLSARGVCGSANNQLADAEAARLLHERGVLYAPDFAVNNGAAVEGVFTMLEGDGAATREKIRERIARIEPLVERLLRDSIARDVTPHDAAMAEARRRVDAA